MEISVEFPDELDVELKGKKILIKGEKGEIEKRFEHPLIKISKKNNKIIFKSDSERKKIKSILNTYKNKLKNVIKGLTEGFEYKLKAVYEHFPMKIEVKNQRLLIHNFLGEKKPRVAKILVGVEVKLEDETIILRGIDKEETGQSAANIEKAGQISGKRDKRIFTDGIYLIEKPD